MGREEDWKEIERSQINYEQGIKDQYRGVDIIKISKENKNNKGLIYYDIQVFYRFNLPVIGNIALYKISGVTKSFVGSDDRI